MPSIASLSTSFVYVDADVPYGYTIAEWQRQRAAAMPARRPFAHVLRNLLRPRVAR